MLYKVLAYEDGENDITFLAYFISSDPSVPIFGFLFHVLSYNCTYSQVSVSICETI
jgi:hypothetical protein